MPRAATSGNQQCWNPGYWGPGLGIQGSYGPQGGDKRQSAILESMPLAADLKYPRRLRYLYWGRAATGVLKSKFSSAGPDYPGHVMYLRQRRVATNNPGIQIYCHLGLGTQSGLVIKGGKKLQSAHWNTCHCNSAYALKLT